MPSLNHLEKKYLLYTFLFNLFWFNLAVPYLAAAVVGANLRFLLFNVGLSLATFILIRSISHKASINIKLALGVLLFTLGADLIMPGYHVLQNGQLQVGEFLGESTTDYYAGTLGAQIGLSGTFLYNFVYVLIPSLLMVSGFLLGYDALRGVHG